MGATYTRQSSYTDGDVITAAHTNDEFNQLLAAFASSTGHTHDGTTAEGGPITKLLGNTLTFGAGTAGTDITITFDGETSDGVLLWKEDEDYFEFSDDILIASTEKLQFRDTAIYINSSADGQLDLVADTEIQLAATTVDLNGNLDVSGSITLGGTAITSTAAELNILDGVTSTATELNALDGITSTVTELNIIDGDTSASSVTVADADRVVLNDGGTMKQVAVTDLSAYFDDEITAMPNLVTVSTLDSGAISSGFGNIDIGSSNLTATGTISLGAASFNDNNITNVGSIQLDSIAGDADTNTSITFSGSDVITMATGGTTALTIDSSQNVTVAGDLTVSGDDITMSTNTSGNLLIADGTNFNSVAVGSLSEISTVANDDVFLAVDTSGGGLKKVTRSTIVSGLAVGGVALSNVVEDTTPQLGGDLDVNGNGLVSTSNGNIAITPNGTGVVRLDGNVDIQSGLIDLKNSGAVSKIKFYCESSNAHAQTVQGAPHSESASNTLTLPSTGGDARLVSTSSTATLTNKTLTTPVIAEIDSGSTITLDATTDIVLDADGGDIFFKDGGTTFGSATNTSGNLIIKSGTTTAMTFDGANVALAGNLTVNGTTSTVNSTTVTVDDPIFTLGGDSAPGSDDNKDRGIEFRYHTGSAAKVGFFGFDDSAGKFTFIPDATNSSEVFSGTAGTIVANIEGNVTGNVTGNTSGTAATVTGAAQSNITSLGTLTTLTVDNVIVNGTTIGHTDDTDLITLADGIATVAGEISVTTLDIGGTNVTSTAAELNILDGVTSTAAELNILDGVTSTTAELNILDGVTSTATELNIMDGDTSASSTTLVDADRVVTNDNGTMKQVALSDVKTYLTSAGFTTDDPTALAIALG
jgi:hypothetical protein